MKLQIAYCDVPMSSYNILKQLLSVSLVMLGGVTDVEFGENVVDVTLGVTKML